MTFYTYITTNPGRTTLYVGMTNNLTERIKEHYEKRGAPQTFAGRYYCYKLIYYEGYKTALQAIEREKEIKKWRREKKEMLINAVNPHWNFLNYTDDFRVGIV
ncbi:MAG TPA: GIY-YIG nuclease family protein [Balneolaceae bacterium]|nr:GIY-YIG nuclease family protein [Balneolaceae bacterium]